MTDDRRVSCIDCGADRTAYDSPAGPHESCRVCGSERRAVSGGFHITAHAEVRFGYHAKHPSPTYRGGSKSRPGLERWGGERPSADGVYRTVRRVVDREGDRYEETVTNPDGTVVHHEAHRLSEHRNRGSAKRGVD
jgi:hypothetical protein